MAWTNLDDVYVSANGGTIAGDLNVNGTLTINDKKGTNTTYDVASQITSLRDSVSHIQSGTESVTPETANTAYKHHVTFGKKYSKKPTVIVTANTSIPNKCFVSVLNMSATGFDICIIRPDIVLTAVYWVAIGS